MSSSNILIKSIISRQVYDIKLVSRQINRNDHDTARKTLVDMNQHFKNDIDIARSMYYKEKCVESESFYAQCLKYKSEINNFSSRM